MINIEKDHIQTDVLVVGGGIAGLMAAIGAAGKGADVLVAEKANTKRSGSGATGNDHFCCYCPPVHGDDMAPILKEYNNSLVGGYIDSPHAVKYLENSFARIQDWHSWGIDMKPTGDWEFTGHAFPGRPRIWLKYAGHNQKPVLTKQAKKAGVKIANHLPIVELIVEDGQVVGAIGLSIAGDTPSLQVIKAKSVILATGSTARLYPSSTPGWMFNMAWCPSCAGATPALAYRAGANLVNMEFPNKHAGPKFFSRAGKATWIGIVSDPQGKPVGPFITKATREVGDITSDVWNTVFTDKMKNGTGPVYMNCSDTAQPELDYMRWGLEHEGNTGMLTQMDQLGIDLHKHMVEFTQYEVFLIGRGVEIDLDGMSSVQGLYAAGDPVGNFRADIAGAATFGWIAGEAAADRAKGMGGFAPAEKNPVVQEKAEFCTALMERENPASWQEANLTLQQIMLDYAGVEVRSETLLSAGITYMRRLRERSKGEVGAYNSHTLLRALESFDLMDVGESVMLTALERKETRAMHKRSDYPFTNPLLGEKFLTIHQEKGQPVLEWRDKL
jgi:succinate dehydrogenase/fumarate reductase flavoprotein subunit